MKIDTILWNCKNFIKSHNFYEGHEYLEALWIQKKENQIKGCIQFFASLELLKRRNINGSISVFNKALKNIENQKIKLLFLKLYNKYKIYYED